MSRSGYNQGTYLAGWRDRERRSEAERAVTAAADASQAIAHAARVRAKLDALMIEKIEAEKAEAARVLQKDTDGLPPRFHCTRDIW